MSFLLAVKRGYLSLFVYNTYIVVVRHNNRLIVITIGRNNGLSHSLSLFSFSLQLLLTPFTTHTVVNTCLTKLHNMQNERLMGITCSGEKTTQKGANGDGYSDHCAKWTFRSQQNQSFFSLNKRKFRPCKTLSIKNNNVPKGGNGFLCLCQEVKKRGSV